MGRPRLKKDELPPGQQKISAFFKMDRTNQGTKDADQGGGSTAGLDVWQSQEVVLQRAWRRKPAAQEQASDQGLQDVEHQLGAMCISSAMHDVHAVVSAPSVGAIDAAVNMQTSCLQPTASGPAAIHAPAHTPAPSASAGPAAPSQLSGTLAAGITAAPSLKNSKGKKPASKSSTFSSSNSSASATEVGAPSAGFPEATRFKLFAFDIETTGLSKDTARIIELALVELTPNAADNSTLTAAATLTDAAADALTEAAGAPAMQGTTEPASAGLCQDPPHEPKGMQQAGAVQGTSTSHSTTHAAARVAWSTLVNPGVGFRKGVSGISLKDVMVPGVPHTANALRTLLRLVTDACKADGSTPLLVAHNGAGFDMPILVAELQRCLIPVPRTWVWLDTLMLARRLRLKQDGKLPNLKQDTLRSHFGLPVPSSLHRALDDARALAGIAAAMLDAAGGAASALPLLLAEVAGERPVGGRLSDIRVLSDPEGPVLRALVASIMRGGVSGASAVPVTVGAAEPLVTPGAMGAPAAGLGIGSQVAGADAGSSRGRVVLTMEEFVQASQLGLVRVVSHNGHAHTSSHPGHGQGSVPPRAGAPGGPNSSGRMDVFHVECAAAPAALPQPGEGALSGGEQAEGAQTAWLPLAVVLRGVKVVYNVAQQYAYKAEGGRGQGITPSFTVTLGAGSPEGTELLAEVGAAFDALAASVATVPAPRWPPLSATPAANPAAVTTSQGPNTGAGQAPAMQQLQVHSVLKPLSSASGSRQAAAAGLKVNLLADVARTTVLATPNSSGSTGSSGGEGGSTCVTWAQQPAVTTTTWRLHTGVLRSKTGEAVPVHLEQVKWPPMVSAGSTCSTGGTSGPGARGVTAAAQLSDAWQEALSAAKQTNVDTLNSVLTRGRPCDVVVVPQMVWRSRQLGAGCKLAATHFLI